MHRTQSDYLRYILASKPKLNISYIGYKILALNSEDGNIVAKLKDDKFSIVAISYDASDFITAKCERL